MWPGPSSRRCQEAGSDSIVRPQSVQDGTITDFRRAVEARKGETVVFSWIEWPSKQVRDEAWPKLRADLRMQPGRDKMPFDGQRMIYGGFATVLDA